LLYLTAQHFFKISVAIARLPTLWLRAWQRQLQGWWLKPQKNIYTTK